MTFLIFASIFILIILGIIITLNETRYKINLFEEESLSELEKKGLYHLELKRAIVTNYLTAASVPKRKVIDINSKIKINDGPCNTNEEELFVIGHTERGIHEIFSCPYSEENRQKLENTVKKYNDMKKPHGGML